MLDLLVGHHISPPIRCLLLALIVTLCSSCDDLQNQPDAAPDGGGEAGVDSGYDADELLRDADVDVPLSDAADADGFRDSGPPPVLVDVSHERELRGVWVATVANINFPSRTGLSADEQQAELVAFLEVMTSLNLNAIFFQVRPEGDALYRSELEPWSRFLSGTQGGDPGYDPLQFLIEAAHPRNIEVHAWFNPYRAKSSHTSLAVAPHISVTNPEEVRRYGSYEWMDPGSEVVRERTRSVIIDVVERYDVDGIHFDDYFYPYPDGSPFPDDRTYQAYLDGGGTMSRDDWRRDNVNQLVREVSEAITSLKPEVRFGISPFGIYRSGVPEGIVGLDQYSEIYSDPVAWVEGGWVEYLAPQLYWPTTQTAQAYGVLLEWWAGVLHEGDRALFVGNYLSQLGSSSAWTVDEITTQVELTRAARDRNARGNIFFHIEPFQSNRSDIATTFSDEFYQSPVLTPPLATATGQSVEPPVVTVLGETLSLSSSESIRAWLIYRDNGSGSFVLDRIVAAEESSITCGSGRWAVSAVSRAGVESQGVVVVME